MTNKLIREPEIGRPFSLETPNFFDGIDLWAREHGARIPALPEQTISYVSPSGLLAVSEIREVVEQDLPVYPLLNGIVGAINDRDEFAPPDGVFAASLNVSERDDNSIGLRLKIEDDNLIIDDDKKRILNLFGIGVSGKPSPRTNVDLGVYQLGSGSGEAIRRINMLHGKPTKIVPGQFVVAHKIKISSDN